MEGPNESRYFFLLTDNKSSFSKLLELAQELGYNIREWDFKEVTSKPENPKSCCLAILQPFKQKLTAAQVTSIWKFVESGARLLLVGQADELGNLGNRQLSKITAKFGVKFNMDCVISPNANLTEMLHPREVIMNDFCANRGLLHAITARAGDNHLQEEPPGGLSTERLDINKRNVSLFYSNGCTLSVERKSCVVLATSGQMCMPHRQPICVLNRDESQQTRFVAFGSSKSLEDELIERKHNTHLARAILTALTHPEKFEINLSDLRTLDVASFSWPADIGSVTDTPISRLQQVEATKTIELHEMPLGLIDASKMVDLIQVARSVNTKLTGGKLSLVKPNYVRTPIEFKFASHGFVLSGIDNQNN